MELERNSNILENLLYSIIEMYISTFEIETQRLDHDQIYRVNICIITLQIMCKRTVVHIIFYYNLKISL